MPPYTGDATKILLSFAMKSGGHLFSQWLRNKLMKSLDYFSTNSVYLDTVSSRELRKIHNAVQVDPKKQLEGYTYVAPDRRFEAQEGFTTIGAMNSSWNEGYTRAMSEADVFIVILTPDYTASEWCMKEWGQFQDENKARGGKGRKPLHGLVVRFSGDISTGSSKPINLNGVDVETFPKVESTGGSMTAMRGTGARSVTHTADGISQGPDTFEHGSGWEISEGSYLKILDNIKPFL